MLGWVSQQLKDHGVVVTARLLGRVVMSRVRVEFGNKLLPVKVVCPCCGWRGRQFDDYIEVGYSGRNIVCPQCESHPRHRYLSLWLAREFELEEKSGVALIFAPEKALARFWEKAAHLKVYRIDLSASRGIEILADIKDLPVESSSVDLVWCHHVLEHINDDRAAIRELHRVLRPGSGELIVSVPMALGTATNEYGYPDAMQSGHWRMYGDDFEERLEQAGLIVQTMNFRLAEEEYRRYAFQPERFYVCKKMGD